MTFLVSLHMQDPVPDWTQAILQLPAPTVLKFFQVENCTEAKQHNPNIKTSKRHYSPNQGQYWHNIDPYVGARNWLLAFVDGTFYQHAANVDFIEGLNEEMSVEAKPPDELAELIAFNQALCDIWYNEYQRDIERYRHIDLVLCNTAIGNDIPIEIAYLCHEYGYKPVVAYHPYVPTQDNEPLTGEAQYYSQRWQTMDAEWKRQGLNVRWMFTEIGPVGYHEDANGNISLHPNDGWQHRDVCNRNLDAYISILEYWAQATADSQAYKENRVLSGQIFTTTINSSGWESFKTNQPELETILNHFAQWQPEEPPPENPPQMVDVSYHRENVPFGALTPQIEAVYARISRDLTVDHSFPSHYEQAKNDNKYIGAFHFLDSRYDMIAQAEFFLSVLQPWQCDLPAAVDVEEVVNPDTGQVIIPLPTERQLDLFFSRLWQSVDRVAIYTSANYWNQITTKNYNADLWVADWRNVQQPAIPTAWNGWVWWQYTATKMYPEYPKPLDTSNFYGSTADLRAYVNTQGGIDRQKLYDAGKAAQRLYLNADFALFKAIANDGRYPTSNEFDYLEDGQAYKGQTAFDAGDTKFYVYYVPVGDWSNIKAEVYNS